MRSKNAFFSMVEMMNSCSVYSSHMSCIQLVPYVSFEFFSFHDQILAKNLWGCTMLRLL
jgi:hypothetical protein